MLQQRMVMAVLSVFFTLTTLHASTTEQLAHDGEVAFYHQNYIEARKSLIPASEQGDLQSLYYLGILELRGYGTPVNYKEAVRYFKEGAQKGHPASKVALGVMMVNGVGTLQDYVAAFNLFSEAAKEGNSDAQLILGWAFKNGVGIQVNKMLAYALWNYVAAQGNEWARVHRDALLYELPESDLYRAQELSSNLPKLWNSVSREQSKMKKYLRKLHKRAQ